MFTSIFPVSLVKVLLVSQTAMTCSYNMTRARLINDAECVQHGRPIHRRRSVMSVTARPTPITSANIMSPCALHSVAKISVVITPMHATIHR